MRTLELVSFGRLAWREAPPPKVERPSDAIVRPLAVARCDLDAAVLAGAAPFRGRVLHWLRDHLPTAIGQQRLFRNAPFKGPYPIGHEMVAEVVELGPDVRDFEVGARVVVPFQIGCGACERCGNGLTANCSTVPARSMYGFGQLGGLQWGGAMSDLVRVPFADAMLLRLPTGVAPTAAAAAADNVADGFRTVEAPLARWPGGPVLVVGGLASSVGLYAVQAAVALGAEEVVYADTDRARLEVAERIGARCVSVEDLRSRRRKYPVTVDASADPDRLALALQSTDAGGVCTSTGIYYSKRTPMPLLEMFGTGVSFVTGRVHARAVAPKVLALMAEGRLRPEQITTRLASWEEAPEAFIDPGPKVVVARSEVMS